MVLIEHEDGTWLIKDTKKCYCGEHEDEACLINGAKRNRKQHSFIRIPVPLQSNAPVLNSFLFIE